MSASSSSDSDDNEEKQRLAQAVDPSFAKKNSLHTNGEASKKLPELPPSKRPRVDDDTPELIEFRKMYSLDVTPESQTFIAKHLTKFLEKNLKEVNQQSSSPVISTNTDAGIKLFAASDNRVTEEDLAEKEHRRRKLPKKKHKRKSKSKNTTDNGSDDSSTSSDEDKLKSVAVSAEWVLSNNSV